MRRLCIRPGAIGDCLCWLPVLAAIGAADTEVWAPGAVLPLFGLAAHRRNLVSSGFSLLGVPGARGAAAVIETLRGFDEILSWSGEKHPELRDAARSLSLPIHFFDALPEGSAREHVSDLFFAQTHAWHGLDAEPAAWRGAGGRRFLLGSLGGMPVPASPPLIIFHPFSGSSLKNWPLAFYRRLAETIPSQWGDRIRIQWCAGPDDPLPDDLAAVAWRFPDLSDLARALSAASLYVGNDSGITHLAAALGIPCLAFFGPERPGRWQPRGASVRVVSGLNPGEPARDIPYEEGERAAYSLIRALLDEYPGTSS